VGLTCCSTLGARAHTSCLPVHGPGVRLTGAPGAQRCRQGCGDLGAPAWGSRSCAVRSPVQGRTGLTVRCSPRSRGCCRR